MRQSVLSVVARLLPPQTGPVERIIYRRRSGGPGNPPRRATLTRQSRQRVRGERERLAPDHKCSEAEGVIRQVDLDGRAFILRERPGDLPELLCEYDNDWGETVKEFLGHRMRESGLLETSPKKQKSKIEVEAIEPVPSEEEAREQQWEAAPSA